jgi:hypothetical protein
VCGATKYLLPELQQLNSETVILMVCACWRHDSSKAVISENRNILYDVQGGFIYVFMRLCVFLFIYLFTHGDATNNQDSKKMLIQFKKFVTVA